MRQRKGSPGSKKEETTSEKRQRGIAIERMTLRQNSGMFPAYWDRKREQRQKAYLLSLTDVNAFKGELGSPQVSSESISTMMPYMILSTKTFTAGLTRPAPP